MTIRNIWDSISETKKKVVTNYFVVLLLCIDWNMKKFLILKDLYLSDSMIAIPFDFFMCTYTSSNLNISM